MTFFNMPPFLKLKIPVLIGITIVIVAVFIGGGVIGWQLVMFKKEVSLIEFLKIEKPEKVEAPSFVYKKGTNLILNDKVFRFVGVNRFGTANDDTIFSCGPGGENPDAYLENMFRTLTDEAGVKVIRFWAFQSYTQGGTDWSSTDRVLKFAKKYDIRVIPVLENQWPDCSNKIIYTPGSYKYNTWYQSGYLSPYDNYVLSYKDYVKRIVKRYKDEPMILMWQLMNEAESKDIAGNCDSKSLYNFASDTSLFIKSLDPNHLVSLGTIGTGQCGTRGEEYVKLHAIPTIDVVEAHDYGNENEALPDLIAADLQIAKNLKKPFFIGEAGISKNTHSLTERARLFDLKIKTIFDNGGAGYLIWQWDNSITGFGASCVGFDKYCFTPDDPFISILKKYSE